MQRCRPTLIASLASRRSCRSCARRWRHAVVQQRREQVQQARRRWMIRPARLLIVDDEVGLLKALCDTLRDQGYETTGFTSGRSALAAMQSAKFDLLLADLMMPGMDGIALLQAALETDPQIVGVIMTGEGTIS